MAWTRATPAAWLGSWRNGWLCCAGREKRGSRASKQNQDPSKG
jgi:hypothetical protein